jgi:hypothetical protein
VRLSEAQDQTDPPATEPAKVSGEEMKRTMMMMVKTMSAMCGKMNND